MNMPKSVPVLTAKDICIGPLKEGKKRCIAQWTKEVFPCWLDIRDTYNDTILYEFDLQRNYTTELDEGIISPHTMARAFNRFTARLGYVVNNPECYKNGRLKPLKNK